MSQDTSGEKTEKATPKRMKEVRKEGGLQKSQDLSAWAGIGAGVAMMPTVFSNVSALLQDAMAQIRSWAVSTSRS
jgi:flagellar biosynthetic protein FlhB